jgi:hypothetical protein
LMAAASWASEAMGAAAGTANEATAAAINNDRFIVVLISCTPYGWPVWTIGVFA